MDNMLDLSREAFQDDALTRLSSVLHETQNATQRGLSSAVPASIAALAEHAKRARNAEALLGTFQAGDYPHVAPSELKRLVDDPMRTAKLAATGEGFLSRIFGPKLDDMVELVARQAGISRTSAHILLGLSAPLVLDALSKEAEIRHLDANGLSRFLNDQEARAAAAVPTAVAGAVAASSGARGANVLEVLNRPNRGATVTHLREHQRHRAIEDQIRAQHIESARRVPVVMWWFLAALLVFSVLTWLVLRMRPATPVEPPRKAAQAEPYTRTTSVPAIPATRAPEPSTAEARPMSPAEKRSEEKPALTKAPVHARKAREQAASTRAERDVSRVEANDTAHEGEPDSTNIEAPADVRAVEQQAAESAKATVAEEAEAVALSAPTTVEEVAPLATTQKELESQVQRAGESPSPRTGLAPATARPAAPAEVGRLGALAPTQPVAANEARTPVDGIPESERTIPLGALPATALPRVLEGGALPPRRFVLGEVTFAAGSTQIEGRDRVLDRAAAALVREPGARLLVEGYSDPRGDPAMNQRLSRERAEAVKAYLVARGVAAERMVSVGAGSTRPLTNDKSPEGRAKNRRVEIVLLSR